MALPSSAQEGGQRLALYSPASRKLGTLSLMSDDEDHDDKSIRLLLLMTHSRHTHTTLSALRIVHSLGEHKDGIEADFFGPHVRGEKSFEKEMI